MKRIIRTICPLMLGLALAGCRPAEKPSEQPAEKPDQPVAQPEAEPPAKPEAQAVAQPPKYSAEQVAAAKKLAEELGVVLKEDDADRVVLVDSAAGRSWADNAQMEQILVFEHLASLTLEGPGIDDQLVPKIAEHVKLTSLMLKNTMVSDTGIAQLAGLKSLKLIDLRVAPMVTDAAMKPLSEMPELRAVRLLGGGVTDAGLATLLSLPRLSELDLRNCRGVTLRGIEKLAAKKSLHTLKLGGTKIDDGVLATVGRMSNLTGLALDNCPITDAGVARLGKLPLEDFTLYQCPNVTDTGLAVLAGYKGLRRLALSDTGVNGAALEKLPHPEKLISLGMAQSPITDAQVVHLAKMTNLKKLNLSETELTDAAVDTLVKLTSLEQLTLTQTRISESGVERLRKALPKCAIRST